MTLPTREKLTLAWNNDPRWNLTPKENIYKFFDDGRCDLNTTLKKNLSQIVSQSRVLQISKWLSFQNDRRFLFLGDGGCVSIKIYLVFAPFPGPGEVVTIVLVHSIFIWNAYMWTQIRWEKYPAQPGLEPGTSGKQVVNMIVSFNKFYRLRMTRKAAMEQLNYGNKYLNI